MFILGWLPFLGFWLAIPTAWWGYRIHSRRLTLTGFALPFGAIFLICAYVVISLYA